MHLSESMKTATFQSRIGDFMTGAPFCVEESTPLKVALEAMKHSDIRHLPILKEGKLVGIVSHRDISLGICEGTLNPALLTVKSVMKTDPFTVSEEASLFEVTGQMIRNKFGSVIVMSGAKVAGIFTTIDALRALRDISMKSSKYFE